MKFIALMVPFIYYILLIFLKIKIGVFFYIKNGSNKETILIDFQFIPTKNENDEYHQIIDIKIRTNDEDDLNHFQRSITTSFKAFLKTWNITSDLKIKVNIQKTIKNEIETTTKILDISNQDKNESLISKKDKQKSSQDVKKIITIFFIFYYLIFLILENYLLCLWINNYFK